MTRHGDLPGEAAPRGRGEPSSLPRMRADVVMVRRGLAPTRSRAQWMIRQGLVLLDGEPLSKTGQPVPPDGELRVLAEPGIIGKGELKLCAALDSFGTLVEGRVAADVGACTGGFTHALLERGARKVYAIDVGEGQLHGKLTGDPRVENMERTDVRSVGSLPEPPSLCVVDVSFISLRKVLPVVGGWLEDGGEVVTLAKPQFEGGRGVVDRRGVVANEATRRRILEDVIAWCRDAGFGVGDWMESPVRGAKGNVEYFLELMCAGTSRQR